MNPLQKIAAAGKKLAGGGAEKPATKTPPPAPAPMLAEVPDAPAKSEPVHYWETRTADALGVPRVRIRALRQKHLKASEDFTRRGNSIVLTVAGVEKMTKLVKAESAAIKAERAKDMPSGPPERLKLVVQRIPANPRLLLCLKPDDKTQRQYLVRVRTNENFTPKMELEAVNGGQNLWQFTGRLPRRKGRW